MEYLSKERYNEIAAELKDLIEVQYPKVKDDLAEARAQGDLSENCGYRAARRAQAKMISRINFLEKVLRYSRIIDTDVLPKDKVGLLSKVGFTNLATDTKMTLTIVSPHEMNLEQGKISMKSPIGEALMGHKVGETVEAHTPAGILKLRIDSISV
ncbi:MAG: transcription elongation factor GreA [Bacteroidales bacterium]|nr:transcription elongation factor GreA [Bacteroidales bacterium]